MKSPLYEQEESSASVAQRLLNKKKLTQEFFNNKLSNETAQDRRLNNFYDKKDKERLQDSESKR